MKKVGQLLLYSSTALLLLISGIWHIAIPLDMIRDRIEDSFMSMGIKVETEGLRKGLFYNLSADKLICYRADSNKLLEDGPKDLRFPGDPLITISDLKAGLDLLSVLRLRPAVLFHGTAAEGELRGAIVPGRDMNLALRGIELRGLGFMRGLSRKGTLSGMLSASLKESKGEMRFSIDGAELNDITKETLKVSDSWGANGYIPLSLFSTLRGIIIFDRGSVNIQSLSLQGKGIHGRFNSMASSLEVMVNSDFALPQVIEIALYKYKRAPGYYIIPFNINR